jgi:tetratricopeptide (TPR) repeat protein
LFAQNQINYFDSGYHYLKANNYKTAVHFFSLYIQKKDDAYAYYNRGQSYKGLQNYDSAQSDYLIASKKLEGFWEAYHQLGELSLLSLDTNQALSYYSKAIQINVLDLNSLVQKANIYMAQKQYDLANQEVIKILEINPNHTRALLYKAIISEAYGKFADAVFYYDRVIALDISNQTAMFNRTMLFERFENWESAKQGYGLLMSMDTNNTTYIQKLAEMEFKLGQAERAIQLLNKLKKPNQMSRESQGVYLHSLIKMGKIKEAEEFKKLNFSTLQKLTVFVNIELELLYKKGEYTNCLSKSKNVLSIDSVNCMAQMFILLCNNSLKKLNGDLVQSLLDLEPCLGDVSEYWYQLALASNGQVDSKTYYKNALKLGHFPLSDHKNFVN